MPESLQAYIRAGEYREIVGMRGSSQPFTRLLLHQLQQLALAQQRVGHVQPVELDLLRMERCPSCSMNQL